MDNQWESKQLYEHPEPHRKGTCGVVCLSAAGVYFLRVGRVAISCPQDWAARIHQKEEGGR